MLLQSLFNLNPLPTGRPLTALAINALVTALVLGRERHVWFPNQFSRSGVQIRISESMLKTALRIS